MSGGTVVFFPQNGANVFTGGQAMPATVVQPAATVQYVQYMAQPVGHPINQPQQNVPETALQKLLRVETKTLGAIQIMIGLIHIGFGAVSAASLGPSYMSIATTSGYPFWAGVFFITSGSLSVSVEKHLTSSLVQCSVGLNITSAIMAIIGTILYCIEFPLFSNSYYYDHSINSAGTGISALLFVFTLLEFGIAVSTAHFGCKATCCNNDPETIAVPYVISGTNMAPTQGSAPPPPSYDSAIVSPKIE